MMSGKKNTNNYNIDFYAFQVTLTPTLVKNRIKPLITTMSENNPESQLTMASSNGGESYLQIF